jgi:predicted amidophosphoribosyltransferase
MEFMQRKLRYSEERSFNLYHLCYYLSKNIQKDADQNLILDFKRYEEPAVRHLLVRAIENLQYLDIDNDLMIVRALSSSEMKIGDMGSIALDLLGLSLSDVYDCTYLPSIVFKKRKIPSVKALNITERSEALAGLYDFKAAEFDGYTKLLIIDDVVTTGTTACAIMMPFLKAHPKTEVIVFALAWTPTAKQQAYILQQQNRGMMVSEPDVPYGSGKKTYCDEDFENGETDVSIFSR